MIGAAEKGRFDFLQYTMNTVICQSNPMDFHYRIMSYNVYPDYSESCWEEIGVIGKNVGLQWGGYWNKQDWPHFQLKN